jgi:hypothetical protein
MGEKETPGIPVWRKPWLRVATCVVSLAFAWWPTAVHLQIAVLVRLNPAAGIAMGYAAPFMLASWCIGFGAAMMRCGDPASARSERVVVMLAIVPVPLFFLRVPVLLAHLF